MTTLLERPAAHSGSSTKNWWTPARQRSLSRTLHLVAAGFIGTYIYAPLSFGAFLQPVLAFGIVPLITLTGMFLWKQAQVRKILKSLRK